MSAAATTHRSRAGSRLFLTYAVASLVPVLILGVVLSGSYRRDGRERALDQGRAQADVIEQMAIAPVLGGRDLRRALTRRERDDLFKATELAIFSNSVVGLRIRSFSGRVVFSDDGETSDALPVTSSAFRRASRGGTDVTISPGPDGGGEVLRVLQPIIPNASGRATGVLELYLPYRPIEVAVTRQIHAAYARLAAVLLGLYLVLALISWGSTRRLRRYAADREYEALHDSLTGLPNRQWFRERAERAISDGSSPGGALVLVDLNRFKQVNDTLGHHAGDDLLVHVAARLRDALRTDDAVARLGGDEFGLLLPGLTGAADTAALLDAVRRELGAELVVEGTTLRPEASFGAAHYPQQGTSVDALLERADAAMYRDKHDGRRARTAEPEHVRAPLETTTVEAT